MNTEPKRIQLSRKKGWKMPPNTVKVDRSTRWGNPYTVTADRDAKTCVELFRKAILRIPTDGFGPTQQDQLMRIHNEALVEDHLRGKDLACWCKPGDPCHADVLLEIANHEQS